MALDIQQGHLVMHNTDCPLALDLHYGWDRKLCKFYFPEN